MSIGRPPAIRRRELPLFGRKGWYLRGIRKFRLKDKKRR
jgi:hypothetical protein